MKFKKIVFGIILVVLVILSAGCTGTERNTTKGIVNIIPELEEPYIISSFNFKVMREESSLNSFYNEIIEKYSFKPYVLRDLEHLTFVTGRYNYEVVLLSGRFDKEYVKTLVEEVLSEDKHIESYKDVEIWSNSYNSIAILSNGLIVVSGDKQDVKEYIDVFKGKKKSIYNTNKDLRDIVDRLPNGIVTQLWGIVPSGGYPALIIGWTYTEEDKNTMKAKAVIKFKNKEDAVEYEEQYVEGFLEMMRNKLFDVNTRQNKEFIEITGKIYMDDIVLIS